MQDEKQTGSYPSLKKFFQKERRLQVKAETSIVYRCRMCHRLVNRRDSLVAVRL